MSDVICEIHWLLFYEHSHAFLRFEYQVIWIHWNQFALRPMNVDRIFHIFLDKYGVT